MNDSMPMICVCVAFGLVGVVETSGSDKLQKLSEVYNIEIVHDGPAQQTNEDIDVTMSTSNDAVMAYTQLFAKELKIYHPELIRRSRVSRIVLCDSLTYRGARYKGLADCENNTLYFDINASSYAVRNESPTAQPGKMNRMCRTIHHELFHLIDANDGGEVAEDLEWLSLNSPGFKYVKSGRPVQNIKFSSAYTDEKGGFLTTYSTSSLAEDKAELYASLVVDHDYVNDRAKADPILQAKVVRLKEILVKFCPKMDEGFWESARKRQDTND